MLQALAVFDDISTALSLLRRTHKAPAERKGKLIRKFDNFRGEALTSSGRLTLRDAVMCEWKRGSENFWHCMDSVTELMANKWREMMEICERRSVLEN